MTKVRFKSGVSLFGLHSEILWAIDRARDVWSICAPGVDYLTVTSGRGGAHSLRSFHFLGLAADLRTRDLTEVQKKETVAALKARLGDNFDVVLETDHLHVEYQPEGKRAYSVEQPFK